MIFIVLFISFCSGLNVNKHIDVDNHHSIKEQQQERTVDYPILYHGGDVIIENFYVHTVFYGSQFSTNSKNLWASFLDGLGSSDWWNIAKQYCKEDAYPCKKAVVGNPIRGGTYTDTTYSYGNTLTDDDTINIVLDAFNNNHFGSHSPNNVDITLVFTDRTVAQNASKTEGLCSSYCGYHSSFTTTTQLDMKYSIVGSPFQCGIVGTGGGGQSVYGCSWFYYYNSTFDESPNNDFEMDSIINTAAHEIAEFATDPDGDGWHNYGTDPNDNAGELADLCAWEFGETTIVLGRYHNEQVGVHNYLLQQLWGLTTPEKQNEQGCQNGGSLLKTTKHSSGIILLPSKLLFLFALLISSSSFVLLF